MKLIKPHFISAEILTLLEEAEEKVIIVSPYCRFQKWHKLKDRLYSLANRGVATEFYIREGESATFEEVYSLGISPVEVKGLHCKIYMNEKYAIVSSMNLLLSSEIASIEIAYKTENKEEYLELVEYVNSYIRKEEYGGTSPHHSLADILFQKGIQVKEDNGGLFLRSRRNIYDAFIEHLPNGKNYLIINGIVSQKEFEYSLDKVEELESNTGFEIKRIPGNANHYAQISGTKSILSKSLYKPLHSEIDSLTECILEFIENIERLKDSVNIRFEK